MTDDLNARIARLVEPEPKLGIAYRLSIEDGVVPRPFKESCDASLRVIEARWPKAVVSLHLSRASEESPIKTSIARHRASIAASWCPVERGYWEPTIQGEGTTPADALALALEAALLSDTALAASERKGEA